MTADVPEVKPERLPDEIEVYLAVMARGVDSVPMVMCFTANGLGGDPEGSARSSLTNYGSGDNEYKRPDRKVRLR